MIERNGGTEARPMAPHIRMIGPEWVDWFNHRRLFHELGRIPPAEYEENHYVQTESDHQVATRTIEPV